jgi:3-isopropylmalate/(R)-2-methylmalate dehydratase small subunit
MDKFSQLKGIVVPIDRVNVDTDQLIPKQYLKLLERTGLGKYLFSDWRFNPDGTPKPDFVLNNRRYRGGRILLARQNFGSGSSREHAVWALKDYGFKALVAPSYADIFYNNCFKNGVLPIILSEAEVSQLFAEVISEEGYELEIDLETQAIRKPEGRSLHFEIDPFKKKCLLEGLDDISLTLQHEKEIRDYEQKLKSFQVIDLVR